MAIDLKLHTEKKRALELNDMLVKEAMRSSHATPFEVQVVSKVRRAFIEELIDAKHRGDDPARIARSINMLCADMMVEFIMQTIPPSQPALVVQSTNSAFTELAGMVQHLVDAYLQGPPGTRPANVNAPPQGTVPEPH